MMLYVDRVEGGLAVGETENGEFLTVSLDDLPGGVREGSVLEKDGSGAWFLNTEEEETRRNTLLDLQEQLFDE